MNNKTVHQHYVPKVYLRGFANFRKDESSLFVYNKENNDIFYTNIENIGLENYFYTVNEAQLVEALFCQFEDMFKDTLQKLILTKDLKKLYPEEKEVLSHFIAIQLLRTKEFRFLLKEGADALINIIGKYNIPDFKEGCVTLSEESLKAIHTYQIFNDFSEFSNIIFDELYWILCINNTDTPFWTSDNPCALYNELEPGNLGLKCKGFQLHFPLSSNLLLVLMNPYLKMSDLSRAKTIKDEDFKERIYKLKDINVIDILPEKEFVIEERVTFENNLQIISSTQFIFSKINKFELADRYLNEFKIYKDKNRKRMNIS